MEELNNKTMDSAKAKEVIEAEKKERSETCSEEIREVMTKHRCTFSVSTVLTDRVIHQIQVVALD